MRPKRNKVVYVEAASLKVHPTAQRQLVPKQVKRIMSDLDLDAIGTFIVAPIDGELYIVDGQHRWTALMKHGFGEWKVRCEVHEDATDAARASALFLKHNNRATVGPYDKFDNAVRAGDEVAVAAKKIAERHGFKVDRQARDGHIACVSTLTRVYQIDSGKVLDEALGLIADAHGHTAAAAEGKYIEGLAHVLARFNGEIERPVLAKKLAKYPGGPSGTLGDAKGLTKIRRCSLSRAVAETIVEAYNHGRRKRLTV